MALSNARCINPAGVQAWKKLAATYSSMTEQVERAARHATENHVAAPARQAGAHPSVGVFRSEEQMHVGVPQGHPEFDSAQEEEFGSLERSPGAQIRTAIWANRQRAVNSFYERLWR